MVTRAGDGWLAGSGSLDGAHTLRGSVATIGKDKTQTQTVDQRQTADSRFANQQFLQNLAQQFGQETQQQQQAQQQTGLTQGVSGVDAASQAFINQMRQHALGGLGGIGAGAFAPSLAQINALTAGLQSPHTQAVIGGVGQQFDRLRDQARTGVQQQATVAGAFGGSRHGVAEAQRLAALDRAQTQQVGQLLNQGFRGAQQAAIPLAAQQAMSPVQALVAQQQLLRGGLGPTGQVSTQQTQQQSIQNLLSQLSQMRQSQQQQRGVESGMQTATGTMLGTTEQVEQGSLFGDLLGIGQVLGGLGLGFGGGGGG